MHKTVTRNEIFPPIRYTIHVLEQDRNRAGKEKKEAELRFPSTGQLTVGVDWLTQIVSQAMCATIPVTPKTTNSLAIDLVAIA